MSQILNAYVERVRYAYDCFSAFCSICDVKKKNNDAFNLSPAFFQISSSSLIQSTCLELAKLYKDTKDEHTLFKLMNIIDQNQTLFSPINRSDLYCFDIPEKDLENGLKELNVKELVQYYRNVFGRKKDEINCLIGLRDKFWAHNDKEYFIKWDRIIETYPIKQGDIAYLIRVAGTMINLFQSLLDGKLISPKSENSNDLTVLLKRVRPCRKERNYDCKQQEMICARAGQWWNDVIIQKERYEMALKREDGYIQPWEEECASRITLPGERFYLIMSLYNAVEYIKEADRIKRNGEPGFSDILFELDSLNAMSFIKKVRDMNVHDLDYKAGIGFNQQNYESKIEGVPYLIDASKTLVLNGNTRFGRLEVEPVVRIFEKYEKSVYERIRLMLDNRGAK